MTRSAVSQHLKILKSAGLVLTHRHLDRHGEGWEAMRDAVRSGWSLTRFAEAAANADANSSGSFAFMVLY